MKYFTAMGFRSTWTQRTYGYRPAMAAPAQVDLIRSPREKFSGKPDNNDVERFHKVSSLRFVDNKKGAKVISALKAMSARNRIKFEGF